MATKRTYSANKPVVKQKRLLKRPPVLAFLVVVILAAAIVGARAIQDHRRNASTTTNNKHIAATQKNGKSTSSPAQSTQPQTSPTSQPSPQPPATQTNKGSTSSGASNKTGQALESPATYSTFASDHTASLSAPTHESTTCVTTPGASCTVEFQQGSIIKSLPAQTTDSTGSAYFFWTPNQSNLKLTSGDWTILLKVSLDGASKTAQDSIKLQVTS